MRNPLKPTKPQATSDRSLRRDDLGFRIVTTAEKRWMEISQMTDIEIILLSTLLGSVVVVILQTFAWLLMLWRNPGGFRAAQKLLLASMIGAPVFLWFASTMLALARSEKNFWEPAIIALATGWIFFLSWFGLRIAYKIRKHYDRSIPAE